MEIRELAAAAAQFRSKLDRIKRANTAVEFAWYPYDTFSVFPVLTRMLTGERRNLLSLADTDCVLDVGCGDGGLSFFFESCGLRVTAVDNAGTNHSGTAGFRSLAAALGSNVEFLDRDLDAGLSWKGRTFGLTMCLGVLYHLKNPYLVLETLARQTRYCLLSTRVAQVTMSGADIEREPVAYLLDLREANDDPTNFWIFSESGLRRILYRSGWEICDFTTTGYDHGSNPAAGDKDQRAFCLLRSKLPDPWSGCDLDGGWHDMENGSWRWTERSFGVRLPAPGAMPATLRLRFTLPEAVLRETGPLRLAATLDGEGLPAREYTTAGEHVYEQPVRGSSQRGASVRFELDKALRQAGADTRELGVQVIFQSGVTPLHPIGW
jgi:2-polyprenyl-3-methyl-5-hydroxy-6-metoxy-1,4-benzoquinol methylase